MAEAGQKKTAHPSLAKTGEKLIWLLLHPGFISTKKEKKKKKKQRTTVWSDDGYVQEKKKKKSGV